MQMEQYGIALVADTKAAMDAETAAAAQCLTVRIIPAPAQLAGRCGFSLKYALEEEKQVASLLQSLGIGCDGLYHAERDGLSVQYRKARI